MPDDVRTILAGDDPVVAVRVISVQGSAPREAGAVMYVSPRAQAGTIGGGELEYRALTAARVLLSGAEAEATLDLPLGPETGQCCGGRVQVGLKRLGRAARDEAAEAIRAAADARPHVYILGAGHVGRALADLLQHLPVRTVVVDSRAGELDRVRASVETRLTPLPEAEIDAAPPGSAFVVLTHDHATDFMLTAAALARGDACYTGMIGSATKRARFESWCRDQGGAVAVQDLTCPIGAAGKGDKRPAVIAAMVAAEAMQALG